MLILLPVAFLVLLMVYKLVAVAAGLVQLHRRGVRTTGVVRHVWEEVDEEGGSKLRAQLDFERADGSTGWLSVLAQRRGRPVLAVGDRLPVVYDPRNPKQRQVVPEGSRRLLITAVVMVVVALGLATWAVVLISIATKGN